MHFRAGWSLAVAVALSAFTGAHAGDDAKRGSDTVSYKGHVVPIVNKYCLPCHAEESDNRSELSLDTYALMMAGGKHGPAVVNGKPETSLLIQKLAEEPPFGDRMPLARRRQSKEPPKRLTEAEVRVLTDWIAQGAKDN
jgi:hypothetical protein